MKAILYKDNAAPYVMEISELEVLNRLEKGCLKMFFNEDEFVAICDSINMENSIIKSAAAIKGDFIVVGLKYGKVISLNDKQIEHVMKSI